MKELPKKATRYTSDVSDAEWGGYWKGLETTSGDMPHRAAQRFLALLYPDPRPSEPKKKSEVERFRRNEEIRRRFEAGERAALLAQEYGMTIQALYKMLRRFRN